MSTCDPMLFKFSSIGSYHKSKSPNKISSGSCDNDNDVSNDNGSNNSDGRASTNRDIGRGSPNRSSSQSSQLIESSIEKFHHYKIRKRYKVLS